MQVSYTEVREMLDQFPVIELPSRVVAGIASASEFHDVAHVEARNQGFEYFTVIVPPELTELMANAVQSETTNNDDDDCGRCRSRCCNRPAGCARLRRRRYCPMHREPPRHFEACDGRSWSGESFCTIRARRKKGKRTLLGFLRTLRPLGWLSTTPTIRYLLLVLLRFRSMPVLRRPLPDYLSAMS